MKMLPIEIRGVQELDAGLSAMGAELATVWGHKAFQASANQLRDAWVAGAPFAPGTRQKYWTLASGESRSASYGHLRDNIRTRKVKPRKETAIVFAVTTGNAYWGRMIEFGTAKMPPRPWARPIIERIRDDLIQTQVEILKQGIDSIARKSASGPRSKTTGRGG
jgi:HK97 gp10 family phage protein